MAHKSERINVRVDEERASRYRAAARVLKLDELSDFVRRACDELADRTGAAKDARAADMPAVVAGSKTAKPLSKAEQASGRRK